MADLSAPHAWRNPGNLINNDLVQFAQAMTDQHQHRAACRPRPPSLKEQALTQLSSVETVLLRHGVINTEHIRCALELLPDNTTP